MFKKFKNNKVVNGALEVVYWKYKKIEESETQVDDTIDGILNTLLIIPIVSVWPLPIPFPVKMSWLNS